MDGLLFLAGVLAIVVIVIWEIRNDGAAPDGPTTGLLAMPAEDARPDPQSDRNRTARKPPRGAAWRPRP